MRCYKCNRELGTGDGNSGMCNLCIANLPSLKFEDNAIIEKVFKCPNCGHEVRERVK